MTALWCCSIAVLLLAPWPAVALRFERLKNVEGKAILFVRDCGTLPHDSKCPDNEKHFSEGDAKIFAHQLASQPQVEEVWLYSGGGNLYEGILMGRMLRQQRMTVRVPSNSRVVAALAAVGVRWPGDPPRYPTIRCVSACTVMFMGGLFRYVDEGSTYEVHSASAFQELDESLAEALKEGGNFREIADRRQKGAMRLAGQLLGLFQNTLVQSLPPNRRPPPCRQRGLFERVMTWELKPWCEDDEETARWANRFSAQYSDAQQRADTERYASEGRACLQDILMRMEREGMKSAIRHLRERLADLGPRAEPALRMVEVMYEVSIQEVDVLPRETMYRMGYLTRELEIQ